MRGIRKFIAIILVATMILPYSSFAFGAESDIANHWAKEEIEYLVGKGIISGYLDGTFKPNNPITRAEFIKIINSIIGYQDKGLIYFSDVKYSDWFYDEIAKAVKAGYISGYNDGTIKPNNPINRQEAAKIIGMVFDLEESTESTKFTDDSQIGDWAKGYVYALKEKGYISGYPDGTFRPNASITRAEAVKMVVNASGTIINNEGEYTKDAYGNVVVNTPDVVLKDMYIEGDLYLTEGIGEGDITLDNVTIDGNTYIKGGGENSITIRHSKLGEVVIKKDAGNVRVVLEGETIIDYISTKSGSKLVVKEGVKVGYIKVTEQANIEVEEGAEIEEIEVEAKNVEIKAEGKISSIIAKEEVKVNDEIIEEDEEVIVDDGKVEKVEDDEDEDEKDKDKDRDKDDDRPRPPIRSIRVENVIVRNGEMHVSLTDSPREVSVSDFTIRVTVDGETEIIDREDIEIVGYHRGYSLVILNIPQVSSDKVTYSVSYRNTPAKTVRMLSIELFTYEENEDGTITISGKVTNPDQIEIRYSEDFDSEPKYILTRDELTQDSEDPYLFHYTIVLKDLPEKPYKINVLAKVFNNEGGWLGAGTTEILPLEISNVNISGDAIVGKTLTASVTPTGAVVNYQWQRADEKNGEYENIDGANKSAYKLTSEDEGKWIRVKVNAIGDFYTGSATSEAVGPVNVAPKPNVISNKLEANFEVE